MITHDFPANVLPIASISTVPTMPQKAPMNTITMDQRFANLPQDEDTKVLKQRPEKLGDYPACYQQWRWDGMRGESLIVLTEDVAHLSEPQLLELLRASPLLEPGSQITCTKSDSRFVFLNFNFQG